MKQLVRVLTDLCMELMEENQVYRERVLELESKALDSSLQAEANKCHQQMLANANQQIKDLYVEIEELTKEVNSLLDENSALKHENNKNNPAVPYPSGLWFSDAPSTVCAGKICAEYDASIALQSGIEPVEYHYRDFATKYDPFN